MKRAFKYIAKKTVTSRSGKRYTRYYYKKKATAANASLKKKLQEQQKRLLKDMPIHGDWSKLTSAQQRRFNKSIEVGRKIAALP